MTDEFVIAISKQIGALEQTVQSAHARVDQLNRDIKEVLNNLTSEVQKFNAHMVRSEDHGKKIELLMTAYSEQKGAKAVLVVIGTLLGSVITAGIGYILK